jgi:hypothetical protein
MTVAVTPTMSVTVAATMVEPRGNVVDSGEVSHTRLRVQLAEHGVCALVLEGL